MVDGLWSMVDGKAPVAKHPYIVSITHCNCHIKLPILCYHIKRFNNTNMKQLDFSLSITAPAAKVWQVLWFDGTYRRWTSAFMEGSYAVSDWQQGSKIQFLSPSGSGMYSLIAELVPNQRMVFAHQGEVLKGVEQPPAAWAGAKESYFLSEKDGTTTLVVTLDTGEEYANYFAETFPKALAIAKELAESPVTLTVRATVAAPVEKAWPCWTEPTHIIQWNSASPDWHTPRAENDLRVGGRFTSRMEARDGSMGFDFGGCYTIVEPHQTIAYTMDDGRKARIDFAPTPEGCAITESFEAEDMNPLEMQQAGWQAILDHFKRYVEGRTNDE
jgi:uncharacterized protein YndB with AHSA1/START domain